MKSEDNPKNNDALPSWNESTFTSRLPSAQDFEKYEAVINGAREFAHIIFDVCPQTKETDIAIQKLQEVCYWANESISHASGNT